MLVFYLLRFIFCFFLMFQSFRLDSNNVRFCFRESFPPGPFLFIVMLRTLQIHKNRSLLLLLCSVGFGCVCGYCVLRLGTSASVEAPPGDEHGPDVNGS